MNKGLVYLVNPSEKGILENAGDRIPIGLLGISSNLKKHGYDTKVFDLNHTKTGKFMWDFAQDKPAAVGISVYSSPIRNKAVRLAKRLRGNTRLVAGGHHATAMPNTVSPYFDATVMGEGEDLMMKALEKDGLIRGEEPDLNETPNLDYDAVNLGDYGINQNGNRTGTIITSRGCAFDCTFCGKLSRKMRYEPIKKVKHQIQTFRDAGFEAIYFVDDIFTLNKDRMAEIVNGIDMPFRVTTRANLLDNSKLEILANAGCEMISLGIESGNEEILKRANKGMTTYDNYSAVAAATKHGIPTKGFFILGLPGETEETASQTIDFAEALRDIGMTHADFYPLTPFPGTAIWRDPKLFGITINDRDYNKYLIAGKGSKCMVDTEELKAERIDELIEEARERFKMRMTL